ncbi:MAG: spondin domain-containing protein [Burkholderiaceae bacterium]
MKFRLSLGAIAATIAVTSLPSTAAYAADLEVRIDNLTRGVHFTPLLVATHPEGTALFAAGDAASAGIQAMAEGGDTAALQDILAQLSCDFDPNPAGGLLGPGHHTTAMVTGGVDTNNRLLSVVGMILPSNDGFVGLNSIRIPAEPGTYTYYANVYDAGTEANDEKRGSGAPGQPGFPVPPPLEPMIGMNATGFSTIAEGFIHIHRGVLGDTDPNGGHSDINSTYHRWLTPAAKITVTVK